MGWWSAETPRTAVGATVGTAVLHPRNAAGAAVGRALGASVSASVSATVGTAVSATVGDPRDTPGAAVGRTLRPGVGPAVRATVLNAGHAFGPAVRGPFEIVEAFAGTVGRFAHRSSV